MSIPLGAASIHASLSSLPAELLASTWSTWTAKAVVDPARLHSWISPARTMARMPSSHDRHLSPPRSSEWQRPSATSMISVHQPAHLSSPRFSAMNELFQANSDLFPRAGPMDWADFSLKRSAHFVAEKTCEMICYLWFSPPSATSLTPTYRRSVSALQLVASSVFVQFVQKLLETTQVSESVIVLSLHYIFRLKEKNAITPGQPGSEFRIAVAALMMANKFLDDNTYTNKTWSEVSGISMLEIGTMEREFLHGVDHSLYVDKTTYESWLNLLKGLVMAKERASRSWRSSRTPNKPPRPSMYSPSNTLFPMRQSPSRRVPPQSYRARSTSPIAVPRAIPRPLTYSTSHAPSSHDTFTGAPHFQSSSDSYPDAASRPTTSRGLLAAHSGQKRPALMAFSPTTDTSFADEQRARKRPPIMHLTIPDRIYQQEASPSDHLQSLSRMSLGGGVSPVSPFDPDGLNYATSCRQTTQSQTLTTAYRAERSLPVPQNLYYYSLHGSGHAQTGEAPIQRKARLHYHKLTEPSSSSYKPPPARDFNYSFNPGVQSLSASPLFGPSHRVTLPAIQDLAWNQRSVNCPYPVYHGGSAHDRRPEYYQGTSNYVIPAAPFNNAGPAGLQLYTNTVPAARQQQSTSRRQQWLSPSTQYHSSPQI